MECVSLRPTGLLKHRLWGLTSGSLIQSVQGGTWGHTFPSSSQVTLLVKEPYSEHHWYRSHYLNLQRAASFILWLCSIPLIGCTVRYSPSPSHMDCFQSFVISNNSTVITFVCSFLHSCGGRDLGYSLGQRLCTLAILIDNCQIALGEKLKR